MISTNVKYKEPGSWKLANVIAFFGKRAFIHVLQLSTNYFLVKLYRKSYGDGILVYVISILWSDITY